MFYICLPVGCLHGKHSFPQLQDTKDNIFINCNAVGMGESVIYLSIFCCFLMAQKLRSIWIVEV